MATTTPTLFLDPPSPSTHRGGLPGSSPDSSTSRDAARPSQKGLNPTGQPVDRDATTAPELIGIARLAANAPLEQTKKNVEYFRLGCRSILNRCDSERVPFAWTINPYRGCEFGCRYCYARYTHEYMELDPTAFEEKIYAKQDAARLLKSELSRLRLEGRGEHIAIGTATDPYQPAEREFGVTRAILETLAEARGLSLSLTTKSNQIVRDVDVLRKIAARSDLHINITVTTLRERLARALEPRAPRPDLRLEALAALRAAGLQAGIFVMPVLPGITDREADLEALAQAAAEHRAQWLASNVLFLMPSAQKVFFPFLGEKFPRLAKQYRRWYARSGYAPEEYRARIYGLFARLRSKHGFSSKPSLRPEPDSAGPSRTRATDEPRICLPADKDHTSGLQDESLLRDRKQESENRSTSFRFSVFRSWPPCLRYNVGVNAFVRMLVSIALANLLPTGFLAVAQERSRFEIDEATAREAIKLGQTEDVEALQRFFEPYNELFRGVTDPPVERITLETRFSRIVTLTATQHRTDHLYTEKEAFASTEELEKNIVLRARMFFFTARTLEPGKDYRMRAYQDDEEFTAKFLEYKNYGAPTSGAAWEVELAFSVPLDELDEEEPLRVVLKSPDGPSLECVFDLAKLK